MSEKVFAGQLKEIESERQAAHASRDAARAALADVERSAETERELEQTVEEVRAGLAYTPELWRTEPRTPEQVHLRDEIRAAMRRIVEWLFSGDGIRLFRDGHIQFFWVDPARSAGWRSRQTGHRFPKRSPVHGGRRTAAAHRQLRRVRR